MGLFNLVFLDQNLFISSLAVVPIGAALQEKVKGIKTGIQRGHSTLKDRGAFIWYLTSCPLSGQRSSSAT